MEKSISEHFQTLLEMTIFLLIHLLVLSTDIVIEPSTTEDFLVFHLTVFQNEDGGR